MPDAYELYKFVNRMPDIGWRDLQKIPLWILRTIRFVRMRAYQLLSLKWLIIFIDIKKDNSMDMSKIYNCYLKIKFKF